MNHKRIIRNVLAGLAVLVFLVAAWFLGPAVMPAQHVEVGIPKGAKAPVDMMLMNQKSEPVSLAQGMGEKGMVLLLVRSADWCPFCKAQLSRSKEIEAPLAALGYKLASLSYDKPPLLAEFADGNGITFQMYSDPGSKMIGELGLRDPQYEDGSFAFGVPRATVLVLAPDGTVKAKFVDADYRSRQSNEQVLEMVKEAN